MIPNGDQMNSTHECDINWPLLPQRARGGHIIPALSQHLLLSVVKWCESGCKVTFQHDCCVVHYEAKVMMYGKKCPITKLWLVPLHQRKQLRLVKIRVRTLALKVEVIKGIYYPTKVLDIWRFVGLVHYYKDIWHKRAYTLDSFAKIFFDKVKFKQTKEEKNTFMRMKVFKQ